MTHSTHRALAALVRANVPAHVIGNPGEAKTASFNAWGAAWDRHAEVVTGAARDKGDFMGMPVEVDGQVIYSPPQWVRNLQKAKSGLLVIDELASTSETFGISMRIVQERFVGEAPLPDTVSIVAISNPVDVAVDGSDLPAPVANRFCHLNWHFDTDNWVEGLLTRFQNPSHPDLSDVLCHPSQVEENYDRIATQIVGFLHSHPAMRSRVPEGDFVNQGKGWPSPRSWTNAATAISHLKPGDDEARLAILEGCVGEAAMTEFVSWSRNADLPAAKDVLNDPSIVKWKSERPDRLFAIVTGVRVLAMDGSPENWTKGMAVMVACAEGGKPDVATAAARKMFAAMPVGAKRPAGTAAAFRDLMTRIENSGRAMRS